MNRIIVNRALFVTCRLCLEDLGVYQIVPEVKEQIQFCFDINVEPFDGLSQLICNKCENILNKYYETKKKFISKQAELKSRISGSNAVPTNPIESVIVSGTENIQSLNKEIVTPSMVVPSVVLIPTVEIPTLQTSLPSVQTSLPSVQTSLPSVQASIHSPLSWAKDYKKRFHCKFCNASYSAKKYLLVHLTKHKGVKEKFSSIFKKHCEIKLKKLDGKPNFTGSDNKVVYDKHKVLESHVADHYILYTDNKDRGKSSSVKNKSSNFMDIQYDSSDTHSEESRSRKKRRVKRRRIYSSNSSTDTVVLDEGSNDTPKVKGEGFQDMDEDSLNNQITANNKGNVSGNMQNDGTINRIIELCYSKYISSQTQEHKNLPEITAVQLKRKFLNIGRKIINTKYMNTIALLRFLQYKNLNINWIQNRGSMDNNFVQIMPKLESDKDSNSKNESGWEDYTSTHKDTLFTYEQLCNGCNNYEPATVNSIMENNIHVLPNNEMNVIDTSDSAVLSSLMPNDTKKLLNENPVENPKQLPKKDKPNSGKIINKTPISDNICMPIITSTTSLSETAPAPEHPRIKVKPVSELLSKETMNRLKDVSKNPNLALQNEKVVAEAPKIFIIPSIQLPVPTPGVGLNISTLPNNTIVNSNSMTDKNKSNDCILLDTVEMPNTRTDSPFKYLKSLLQMHNIVLLNTDVILTTDFHCLIKFKVLYKQETKDRPVILCLSLHCHKNVFCLKVKDRNQEDIDYPKISAHWQWEILKIYTGDVVEKILNNAMKVSQETFEYTNSFLCLLKSIKCNST